VTSAPAPGKPPAPRRWVKAVGVVLILIASLPLLAIAAGFAYAFLNERRVQAETERIRGTVRVGSTLSELVLTTSEPVDRGRLLECYEATCAEAPGFVLHKGGDAFYGTLGVEGPSVSFDSAEDLRARRGEVDRIACPRVAVTFCGRPRITFVVERDDQGRVRAVGPLSGSSD
jgi:hypothetical protein